MKRTLFLMTLGTLILAVSCSEKENQDETPVTAQLTVGPESVTVNSSASSKNIGVSSNTTWAASTEADWITISPANGDGDGIVKLEMAANSAPEGKCAAERTATVSIFAYADKNKDGKYGDGDVKDTQAVKTVSVKQFGEDLILLVTPDESGTAFSCEGGQFGITVEYNSEYTVETSVSWIKLAQTKSSIKTTYTAVVEANETYESRSGIITFKAGDQTSEITVTEEAKPAAKPLPDKTHALSGEFTVSLSGRKVKFSPGNLYWDGVEFCFEDKQTDAFTKATAGADKAGTDDNGHDYYNWTTNHISHFYWSSDYRKAIAIAYDDNGDRTGFFADSLSADWRTLSEEEWDYIITKHQVNRKVTIGDTLYGFVIAPDGVKTAVPDSYSEEAWAEAEKAGYVLLPAVGQREADGIIKYINWGYYMSGTWNGSEPTVMKFNVDFRGGYSPAWTESASIGNLIRLVTVVSE